MVDCSLLDLGFNIRRQCPVTCFRSGCIVCPAELFDIRLFIVANGKSVTHFFSDVVMTDWHMTT